MKEVYFTMSVKFEFYLTDYDAAKLVALKQETEKDSMAVNEYAAELLSTFLFSVYPDSAKLYEEIDDILP